MIPQFEFLKELLNTASPTGSELAGQKVWAEHVKPFSNEVNIDAYGNTWATFEGTSDQTLMLAAHADEIGFMINHISDDGFINVVPVGGSDVAITRGKRVFFAAENGLVSGIVCNTAIHIRKDGTIEKAPKWHEISLDVGASSRVEVNDMGLHVGVKGVYDIEPMQLSEHRLSSRAIDNKISSYLLARVFEQLRSSETRPANSIAAVNAVQEEVGGNGAKMITDRLKPSLALVFDVTHATDSPGVNKKRFGDVKLGGGPTLTHGTANHPVLVDRLKKLAIEKNIPIQHEATSRTTGTDTDKIFIANTGIPSALISIPLRYMHSPVELVDTRDVEHTIALVVAFIESLKAEDQFAYSL